MDTKFINPIIYATLNVLETNAFTKPETGKPYLKKDGVPREIYMVLSELLAKQLGLSP